MMAHANKAGGHGIARPHARGSINPLGVGSIVRTLYPIPPSSARCSAVLSPPGTRRCLRRAGLDAQSQRQNAGAVAERSRHTCGLSESSALLRAPFLKRPRHGSWIVWQ
jgi:hypothetical protein